jgi:hypothetical protein
MFHRQRGTQKLLRHGDGATTRGHAGREIPRPHAEERQAHNSVQARDPQGAAFAMYIAVDSVAAAAERTTTRGGQVLLGPQERSPAAPELAIA